MNQLFAHKWIKGLAWLGLCICWIAGYFLNKNTQEQRISHYLEADDTPSEYIAPNIYCLKDANHASYLLIGEAKGYGGKIQVVIKTSTTGEIENVILDDHKETPSYLNKLISKKYLNQFEKLPLTDPNHFKTVNAISGATTSSTAIKNAVLQAAETYNVEVLQQESGQFKPAVHYQFGLAELTVVAILLMYFTVRVLRKISQKRMQRITTLISLILLGFMFNQSIGLSRLVALLSGWFPPLAINLAFYLLLGTTLVIIIWKKENFYCQWACPFGAIQDTIGSLTNANKKMIHQLVWLPNLLTWIALSIAFLFRAPEWTDYTIFSALFDFTASDFIFILLGLTLVMSVFMHRAWCRYLCPVGEIFNTCIALRKSIRRNEKEKQNFCGDSHSCN